MKPLITFNNFKPKLIPKSGLYNANLNSAIAHAKYVFVGEIHGAKENCDVLYSLIKHYNIKNLSLELDIELKPFVDSCIIGKPGFDLIDTPYFVASVLSVEMAKTLYIIHKENLINDIYYFGNDEEANTASTILGLKARGPILCLRGNWHTMPNIYKEDNELQHKSSYLFVKDKYPNTTNIGYVYQSGSIYNANTGIMTFDDTAKPKKHYEIIKNKKYSNYYELIIPKATPIEYNYPTNVSKDYQKGSRIFDQAVDIVRKWDEVGRGVGPFGIMRVMHNGYAMAMDIMDELCENHIVRMEFIKYDDGEDGIKYHIITKEELAKKFPNEEWYEPKHKSGFDYDLAKEIL